MTDYEMLALMQRVRHCVQTDFDFQHLAAARQRKPQCSVVLRRAPWPASGNISIFISSS
jgi:predicted nuclease of predicted toxin-antitoxin system